jgi:5-formyltetrahydrofolate cyclo-ligase
MSTKKSELRKIYLAKRNALSENERANLSQQLCDLFFASLDLSSIKVIHTYLPIESKYEPDTWLIIDRIKKEFPFIQLVIPRIVGEKIESILFEGADQLRKTKWGIVEPVNGILIDPKEIDLVIVPLLAFDQTGHRVGYGKGYYDRFLKECRLECRKVGLSFFLAEATIEGVNPFDISLHMVFTPQKVCHF